MLKKQKKNIFHVCVYMYRAFINDVEHIEMRKWVKIVKFNLKILIQSLRKNMVWRNTKKLILKPYICLKRSFSNLFANSIYFLTKFKDIIDLKIILNCSKI